MIQKNNTSPYRPLTGPVGSLLIDWSGFDFTGGGGGGGGGGGRLSGSGDVCFWRSPAPSS
eukprot:COSAG05_NODE_1654_length_4332_cov_9.405150_3_plen_60_part_00